MQETTGDPISARLARSDQGDPDALVELIPLVYAELGRLAHGFLRHERPGHTLETGALIHEAFLRLAGQDLGRCRHRAQFFAIAARTMRRILVEHARRRHARKRGGTARRLSLADVAETGVVLDPMLPDLDEALDALARAAPEQAQVVELRYFGGLEAGEIAEALGRSVPTVNRRWRAARAWLYRYLSPDRQARISGKPAGGRGAQP